MRMVFNEMPPDETEELVQLRRQIANYWNELSFCDDSGGTTWDVLDELRVEVTELLERGTRDDVRRASRVTAKAEFLRRIGGNQ